MQSARVRTATVLLRAWKRSWVASWRCVVHRGAELEVAAPRPQLDIHHSEGGRGPHAVQDIVAASPSFDVVGFVPALREYMTVVNPYKSARHAPPPSHLLHRWSATEGGAVKLAPISAWHMPHGAMPRAPPEPVRMQSQADDDGHHGQHRPRPPVDGGGSMW